MVKATRRARLPSGASSRKPLVSVIMPVYREKPAWLSEAINSVQKQTYRTWELVAVLDDPHNTALKHLLQAAARQDPRIRLLVNERNRGRGASRNRAIAAARGQYIAILDADDRMARQRLAVQVAYAQQHPDAGLIFTWAAYIDDAGVIVHHFRPPERWFAHFRRYFFTEHCLVHSTMFCRTSTLVAIPYDPTFIRSQDYEFWLRAYASGLSFDLISQELVQYRVPLADYQERVTKQRAFSTWASRALRKHFRVFRGNGWYLSRLVGTEILRAALALTPNRVLIWLVRKRDARN